MGHYYLAAEVKLGNFPRHLVSKRALGLVSLCFAEVTWLPHQGKIVALQVPCWLPDDLLLPRFLRQGQIVVRSARVVDEDLSKLGVEWAQLAVIVEHLLMG